MNALHVKQLEKSYGAKQVFSNVSLVHEEGALGIAGANGSGKSTFLKCIGYLLRPSRGHFNWEKDSSSLDRQTFKNHMGYAAPYINLYNELSCRENLSFLAKIRHSPSQLNIMKWIRKVGLEPVADQPFGTLSTGQQQRMRLASALFHQPDVLLLDEPGSNLDQAGRQLIASITETCHAQDILVIIASNNYDELNLCDRIYSIEQESFL